jgi:hypothetical protein
MDNNLSILQVPVDLNDASLGTMNYCKNHAKITKEHLVKFAATYVDTETRAWQDDLMLHKTIRNSLTEKAYKLVSMDRTPYTVQGEESGLLLFRHVLDKSSVDTTVDPDTIRLRLAKAPEKYAQLGYDTKAFNDWITEQVSQLTQNGVQETDLSYLRAFLFTSYEKSPDQSFVSYIGSQKDHIRDHPEDVLTWKQLMSRASKKVDSLDVAAQQAAMQEHSNEDATILTLQAEVRKHTKTIKKMSKQLLNKKKDGSHNNGKPPKTKESSFPEHLKTKGRPTDVTKPEVINGKKYYWCDTHKNWGSHAGSECRKAKKDKSNDKSNDANQNKKKGSYVAALAAIKS